MTIAQEILAGHRCQYCEGRTELVDDAQVYKRSYGGKLYLCKPCWAYVGVHKDTNPPQSLGTVANADLRALRKTCHALFDSLWKRSRKNRSRSAAYAWLALQLDMIPGLVHIGMFDEETCERIIEICRPIYDRRQEEIRQSYTNQITPSCSIPSTQKPAPSTT